MTGLINEATVGSIIVSELGGMPLFENDLRRLGEVDMRDEASASKADANSSISGIPVLNQRVGKNIRESGVPFLNQYLSAK